MKHLSDEEVNNYELDRLKEYQDRTEYLRKYHQNNIRQFRFCLNRNTDADIIAYLESLPNIQGYLRELVKKDMNK